MPDPGGMVPGPDVSGTGDRERDACTCETLRGSSGPGSGDGLASGGAAGGGAVAVAFPSPRP